MRWVANEQFTGMIPVFLKSMTAWLRGVAVAFVAASSASASLASEPIPNGTYAGFVVGRGNAMNEITDVDGFAHWYQPNWKTEYSRKDNFAGFVAGHKFSPAGLPLRFEFGLTGGSYRAQSNQLDPNGLDETVRSNFKWISTAQLGFDFPLGDVRTIFFLGVAAARISHSVTDIDTVCVSGCETDDRKFAKNVDPDDSFATSLTALAPVVSIAVEYPIEQNWSLRFGASYMEFSPSRHFVNRTGNNPCGRGGPRRPCPYDISSRMVSAHLSIIRYFGS